LSDNDRRTASDGERVDLNRRTFIKRSAVAGLAASAAIPTSARAASPRHDKPAAKHTPASVPRSDTRPNILVIVVDQFRYPRWFPEQSKIDEWLPNLARLRREATVFENHYTASNMCVAARGTLLTGLYSHQTGVMLTNAISDSSTLSSDFPTWGHQLRDHGYETVWYGKWHCGPKPDKTVGGLEPYGFDGGTYPSPNGNPEQGLQRDPGIVDQFVDWFEANASNAKKPWCTTVSLVNPHDINWWPNFTSGNQADATQSIGYDFDSGPPNVESTQDLIDHKPRLQLAYQQTLELICGPEQVQGIGKEAAWDKMLNLYAWFQQQVDGHIGRVLDTLYAQPKVAENTIVIFTSDHGEYGGSHGLRAKGGAVYEEGIHVPLYVVDPHHVLSNGRTSSRTQYTSSVDFSSMLLTIATGSSAWRANPAYSHIAKRLDLVKIAEDRKSRGRPWIAHATDETTVEELTTTYRFANTAPHHITSVRTPTSKYAVYANWPQNGDAIEAADQDHELYDLTSPGGYLELNNLAGEGTHLQNSMHELLQKVIKDEIREPLPKHLQTAQEQGYDNYYTLSDGLDF
jgi:arylsulfatase A-like enzyme